MSKAISNQDIVVIHTVDGIWKMKHYPIEVTHARQRPLSLLEQYILRAFNEIKGCTVEDIVEQFGLDVMLVNSTLRVLKLCKVIDSKIKDQKSLEIEEARKNLESELQSVLGKLAHSGGTEEAIIELRGKRVRIQEQLENIVSSEIKGIETFTVSENGKQSLRDLHIKEPVESKIYSMLRCMSSGKLMILGQQDLPKNSIDEGWTRTPTIQQKDWTNPLTKKYQANIPNQSEVEKALSDFYPNDEIQINSTKLLEERYENGEVHIPIHLTLTICKSSKQPKVIVNLDRNELTELKWITDTISSKSNLDSIISLVSQTLPKHTGNGASLVDVHPFARLDYIISDEVGGDGIIVSKNFEEITNKFILDLNNVDRLLSSRTTVCIDSKLKQKYHFNTPNNDLPLSITIPDNISMGKNSFCTESGYLEAGHITIKNSEGKNIPLPVINYSTKRGKKYIKEVDSYLRGMLSAEDCYILTGLELDLNRWVRNATSKLNSDSITSLLNNFDKLQQKIHDVTNPKGIDHLPMCVNELLQSHGRQIFDDKSGLQKLIQLINKDDINIITSSKAKSWNLIQHELHKYVIATNTLENNESDLANLWFEVRQRKTQLAWEEMARLEFALSKNATFTFNEVNRHIERIVKDLIVGHDQNLGTLADMIKSLENAQIISKEMRKEMDKNKAWRNIITHQHDIDANLENTNLSIKVLRILSDINPPIGDKRFEEVDSVRDFTWNFTTQQLEDYINSLSTLSKTLEKPFTLDNEIWIDLIQDRLPLDYQEIPKQIIDELDVLSKSAHGLNTSKLKTKIISDCVSNMVKSLPKPISYSIPDDVGNLLDLLKENNLQIKSKEIAKSYLSEIPYTTSVTDLFDEISSCKSIEIFVSKSENIVRWKRTIEQKGFSVDYDQLSLATKDITERLEKSNSKELLKLVLSEKLKTGIKAEQVFDNILELVDFADQNDAWLSTVNSLENYVFERVKIVMNKQDSFVEWLEETTSSKLKNSKLQNLHKKLLQEKKRLTKKKTKKGGKK